MNSINRQVKHAGMAAIALTMLAAVVIFAAFAIPAQAQTETLLYQFTNTPDGSMPTAGPILKGTTLYGTAANGGEANGYAYGIVYAISTTTVSYTHLDGVRGIQFNRSPEFPIGRGRVPHPEVGDKG